MDAKYIICSNFAELYLIYEIACIDQYVLRLQQYLLGCAYPACDFSLVRCKCFY